MKLTEKINRTNEKFTKEDKAQFDAFLKLIKEAKSYLEKDGALRTIASTYDKVFMFDIDNNKQKLERIEKTMKTLMRDMKLA